MAIIEQTGVLKQVDDEGNVVVLYPAVKTDSTLLESGAPADAAAVGEALKNVKPADSSVTLSQAEYDALSDEEKNNGTTYFISDANGECDATQVSFSSENYSATTVKEAFEEVNSSLTASDNLKFHFATDGEGTYGFLGADGSLIPFIVEPKTETITVVLSNGAGLSTQYVTIPSGQKLVGLVTFETNAWKYSQSNLSSYRPYCDYVNNRIVFETYGIGSMRNETKVTYLYYDN